MHTPQTPHSARAHSTATDEPVSHDLTRSDEFGSNPDLSHAASASPFSTGFNVRAQWTALRALLVMMLVLGFVYPMVLVGVGKLSPDKSNGGLLRNTNNEIVASRLIANPVEGDQWFQPRPSAAGDHGWDAMSSSASNAAVVSQEYQDEIAQRRAEVAAREGVSEDHVPVDAVTASGSGLDPHISTAYAEIQVPRIAKATGLGEDDLRQLIKVNQVGFMNSFTGSPNGVAVNVVTLNYDLAKLVAE